MKSELYHRTWDLFAHFETIVHVLYTVFQKHSSCVVILVYILKELFLSRYAIFVIEGDGYAYSLKD